MVDEARLTRLTVCKKELFFFWCREKNFTEGFQLKWSQLLVAEIFATYAVECAMMTSKSRSSLKNRKSIESDAKLLKMPSLQSAHYNLCLKKPKQLNSMNWLSHTNKKIQWD